MIASRGTNLAANAVAMPLRATASGSPPATVFVADDDDAVRAGLRIILKEDGYDVIEASTGSEALLFLAAAADGEQPIPDVLVLDVNMPGISGLGILRAMRRFASPPPTIVITGFRDPSIDTMARRFGALQVIHKPLDVEVLRTAVISAALRGRVSVG